MPNRDSTLRGLTVAVTGATGFIGRRLVPALAAAGAKVRVIVRSGASARALGGAALDVRQGSLTDAGFLADTLQGADAVLHLAYDVRASGEQNLAAFAGLLAAARQSGEARFVHMSSIVVYDDWPGGRVDERSPMLRPAEGYRGAKIAMEAQLAASGLEAVALQPTLVWGPGSPMWTDRFARALLHGAVVLPEPAGLCQGVFVDDVVQVCLLALARRKNGFGRFIVNGPAPFAWSALLDGYRDILGRGEVRRVAAESLRPRDPDPAGTGPSLAARVSAVGRRALGQNRFEALVRRARGWQPPSDLRPDATLYALMTAHGDCPPDLARSELGYAPAFDLARGLAATRPHLLALAAR